ncbi:MAG: DUF4097 family beta strand repeat-containing protein [bacterium]
MRAMVRLMCVLLLLIGSVMIIIAQDTRKVSKTIQLKPDGKVVIDTYKGSVDVVGWDKNEVNITATIEADGHNRYSRERVEDTEIRIDESSSTVRIKSDYRRTNRHGSFFGLFSSDDGTMPFVHYKISMPRTAKLVVKDYKSENTIVGLRSDVDINTYKGTVRLENLEGSVSLNTYKGEATVKLAAVRNRCSFDTYKGEIGVKIPRGSGFEVNLDIEKNGEFSSDFTLEKRSASKRSKGYHYSEKINGGGPEVLLKSYRGTIRLESY